jgi:DNA-binding beta-propeller fold protein YncE
MLAIAVLGLCLASTASARRLVFWSNSFANRISYAPVIEGGRGADLPIDPAYVNDPYGTAIDSAAGKVYWLNKNNSSIGYANLDGSAPGLLNTAGAPFANPAGLAIDPAGRRIYWGNPETGNGSIGYANLDGSGGGRLDIAGATAEPNGLAIDPANGRIYWSNFGANRISHMPLGGGAGHDLETPGASIDGPEGVAIDSATSRIYWTNQKGSSIGYAGLDGGAGGTANLNQFVSKPIGLATDGAAVYWASAGSDRVEAGNFAACCAVPLETAGATQSGVAFPVILESPSNNGVIKVQGAHKPGSNLVCSGGDWRGDLIESFLYRAPQSVSYQWFRNRMPITEATAQTLTANKVGSYTCQITATNFAGVNAELSPYDFSVNATISFKKVTFNRKKGTATLRVAVTGGGRLDVYGKGVANAQRKHATGTAKITVRTSGKARIKLMKTGRAKVKARVSYTPEGGRAIKRFKAIVLKKSPRR